MKQKLKVESENSFYKYLAILIIGGIGSFLVSYFLIKNSFNDPYPQILGVILGIFFGILGTISIITIYKLDTIFVYSDHIEIISILGHVKKKIYRNKIITWVELDKANKYDEWKELTIYTDKTNYKLSSSIYENYLELKNALVSGIKKDSKNEIKLIRRKNLYWAISFVIAGSFFIFTFYNFFFMKHEDIKDSELETITDVITNKAEINSRSKGSNSIYIKLKSYPLFNFEISGNSYSATFTSDFINNVKVGDTLNLKILKDQYKMKITKEKPLGFWDKTVNYSYISVYELHDKNFSYITLDKYNLQNKKDRTSGYWLFGSFGIIGIFLIGSGLYLFKYSFN
jgi:hypothetical protein